MNWKQICFGIFLFVFFWSSVGSAQAQSTDLLVRAVFPNPLGSDSNEWILLENSTLNTIPSTTLSLQDTIGAVKTYKIPFDIQPGSFTFVSATESGIALNNLEDTVQLVREGQVIDQSFLYSNAQDDQVWWRSESGEWQWESISEFMTRIETKNFTLVSEEEDVASPSSSPSLVVSYNEGDLEKESSMNSLDTASLNIESPRVTKYLGTSHSLTPHLEETELYKKPSLKDIDFPEFDFERETALFVWWKKQALIGSLCLVFGGSCWVCLCFPYWWQKYRWRL